MTISPNYAEFPYLEVRFLDDFVFYLASPLCSLLFCSSFMSLLAVHFPKFDFLAPFNALVALLNSAKKKSVATLLRKAYLSEIETHLDTTKPDITTQQTCAMKSVLATTSAVTSA